MKVSVLTAALPGRESMLAEAQASVLAQECPGVQVEHLIGIDLERRGAGPVLNTLLTLAEGDWLMVLDDDDLLAPNHLATVTDPDRRLGADVIYTRPHVEGGEFTQYDRPFDALAMGVRNIVSHTALIRTDLVRQVGGWNAVRWFDWDLFRRLEQIGADFHWVDEQTWTYRLHGANWSQGTLEGAPA